MAMALTLTGCGSSGSGDREFEGQELHLYNWGEYMGENLIADFEEQTGAKVVVDYFDSNEQMYIKVANGEAYDVLVPSDYMIERLIQEDLLQPLDKSKLSNLDLLNEDVMGLEYDPENEYSIPYFWGTVGIVYDKNKVSEEDLQAEGYNIFLDTKYKGDIYLYDSERDSFMMALKALGYSMNTSDENELNEAYEVLSDADKKARYDQYGFAGVDPNFNPNAGFGGFGGGGFGFGDLGDIFGDFFGGGTASSSGRRRGPAKGQNVVSEIEISFEDAAFGCEREITFSRIETCSTCHGTGAKEGTSPQTCSYCHGTGTVRTQQNFMGMTMQSNQPCPKCGGTGTIITDPCTACRGKGKVRHTKTVRVKVPAGIDDGQSFRVRDEGNAGSNGGPNGDLLVTVSVRKHPIFTRDGANVMCQMPISFTQAALGASIEVPTLDGKVRYQIPEGTQTGTTFRLRGKGIPYVGYKTRGDQFVTVVVETPTKLTREQKELLKQLESSVGDDGQPKRKSFFDKLKG